MTFMHETLHSNVGIGAKDPKAYGFTGPVVDRMNIIRAELGASYGQRESYHGKLAADGFKYIPFSSGAKMLLDNKVAPKQSYIKFK